MSKIEYISTDKAPIPLAPYSQAIKANGTVYVSGQGPLKLDGSIVKGDIKTATDITLTNLKNVLEGAGSSLDKIVKINIFLVDIDQFGQVNEVYGKFFNTHKPARSCVAVKSLPAGFEIEIEAIALA